MVIEPDIESPTVNTSLSENMNALLVEKNSLSSPPTKELTVNGVETIFLSDKPGGPSNEITSNFKFSRGGGPQFCPEKSSTKEGTTIVLSDMVMDCIMLNMNNTLVGNFFSLRLNMEMVLKWVATKWNLKGSVFVSAMLRALFLFKIIVEEDVIMVLSGFWAYGKNNLYLCRWKLGFDPVADLHKMASIWVSLLGIILEYWDESIFRWIGNMFGHFIAMVDITKAKFKVVYAHFAFKQRESISNLLDSPHKPTNDTIVTFDPFVLMSTIGDPPGKAPQPLSSSLDQVLCPYGMSTNSPR
ncbi:hypothetical protein SUGI_0602190 [Cryptomeria japonica]|nr:hypothetical protein SUGI_0602190 [Cryptomeria japonica]